MQSSVVLDTTGSFSGAGAAYSSTSLRCTFFDPPHRGMLIVTEDDYEFVGQLSQVGSQSWVGDFSPEERILSWRDTRILSAVVTNKDKASTTGPAIRGWNEVATGGGVSESGIKRIRKERETVFGW